jgi:hypothetical protein
LLENVIEQKGGNSKARKEKMDSRFSRKEIQEMAQLLKEVKYIEFIYRAIDLDPKTFLKAN